MDVRDPAERVRGGRRLRRNTARQHAAVALVLAELLVAAPAGAAEKPRGLVELEGERTERRLSEPLERCSDGGEAVRVALSDHYGVHFVIYVLDHCGPVATLVSRVVLCDEDALRAEHRLSTGELASFERIVADTHLWDDRRRPLGSHPRTGWRFALLEALGRRDVFYQGPDAEEHPAFTKLLDFFHRVSGRGTDVDALWSGLCEPVAAKVWTTGKPIAISPGNRCAKGESSSLYGCVVSPEPVQRVEARYPTAARAAKVTGMVVVQTIVDSQGRVEAVKALGCTAPGHGFEEAAVGAEKSRRYRPATLQGHPVSVVLTSKVTFGDP